VRLVAEEASVLSKSGIQAVKAVAALAELPVGAYAGAATIARKTGAPENYLGKLLRQLAVRGVLASRKGLGGGFRLARSAAAISLYDVVEWIDSPERWSGCVLGRSRCRDEEACRLHRRWAGVRDMYLGFLRGTTIADVLVPDRPERSGGVS
jgi:Rrf2 family protein